MTNIIRRIIIIVFILQIMFAIGNVSQAAFWDDIFTLGGDFIEKGKQQASSGEIEIIDSNGNKTSIDAPSDANIQPIINNIYNILFPLGVAATVIVGGVLGIKFMMASAEDKAKIKESLVPYVAGCIVIYGAFGIWKLAITVFSTLT